MTARFPSRRRFATMATVLIGGAALSVLPGCSAGKITQTASQVAPVPGANASASPNAAITVRNALIAYNSPQGYSTGSTAPIVVRIFNAGPTSVTLVRVSAGDAAAAVVLTGTTTDVATATTSPSASPATAADLNVVVGADSFAALVPGAGPSLQIIGLTRPVGPGDSISLTFSFSDGSAITTPVPVGPPATPAPRLPQSPSHGE